VIAYAVAGLGIGALLLAVAARLSRTSSGPAVPDTLGDAPPADAPGTESVQASPMPASIGAAPVAASGWRWPSTAEPYRETIVRSAQGQGISPDLLARVLYQESRFRPEIIDGRKRSTAGAVGIAQFMPGTAAGFGIDPTDPAQAIPAAARYLRSLYDRFGSWPLALASYNWGQGNVARRGIDAAPLETRRYVAEILGDIPS